MQYLLLIYENEAIESAMTPEERRALFAEYMQLSAEVRASGHLLGGDALHPTSTATTVRVRDGKVVHTDGPFAETKEQLGGYYLVEAPNLDEALAIARKIPAARTGCIEVRPVVNAAELRAGER